MIVHFANLGEEAVAGMVVSGVVSLLLGAKYLYQVFANSDKCVQHMRICRSSKKLIAHAFIGSFAIFVSHLAMFLEQGFYLRSDGIMVFWANYVAYAIASYHLFHILSCFMWAEKGSRESNARTSVAFWVVMGVFGTLTAANYNWAYFGVALFPLTLSVATLYLTSHREDKIAKGKMLWLSLGLAAFVLVWAFSPSGLNELNLEDAGLGLLILESLVFFFCYFVCIFYYIPRKKAILAANKGKGRLRGPTPAGKKCPQCRSDSGVFSSSSGSDSP